MVELRLTGRLASAGFAAGPLAVMRNSASGKRSSGDPAAEAGALRRAIAAALRQLSDLAAHAEGDGAEILAFQIAMLEDDTLSEPAFSTIAAGAGADQSWRMALDAEIQGYEAADDEHFKARASDLRDIRDRVLAVLFGTELESGSPAGAIILGEDMTPSRFLATDWSGGV
jgi:phosphoenolpyruvate-protein phosphotransferase (PTS system enzyme I)